MGDEDDVYGHFLRVFASYQRVREFASAAKLVRLATVVLHV
jgi:hypothetical protein